jgi:TonB family protein
MKTKNHYQKPVQFKLLFILPVVILILAGVMACSASKKAASTRTEVAPPPPPPPPPIPSKSDKDKAVNETTDEEVPFVVVEEMPMFPGGDAELLKFIAEHTSYPNTAKENNIQGRVIIRFCVTKAGGVDRISILKGVSPELDEEALRVVKTLPSFQPGKQGGKPVPVWYMIPITFTLSGEKPAHPPKYEITGNDTIYSYTNVMPEFPGGESAFIKFRSDNINYSPELKSLGVEGFVMVGIDIDKNGSLSNFRIERGASPSLDAEALRVAKLMPAFEPGKEKGRPVKFKISIPFTFFATPMQLPEIKEGDPFVVVEEMPMFPGGDSLLLDYLIKNTKYPETAKANNIQGRVIIRFCVTEVGGVDRVSVLKGVSPELDAEAIRVVNTLPAFKPGKQGGKPVSVWYMVPITFALGPKSSDGKNATPPPPSTPPPSYDEIPAFPGGEPAIFKFISSNINYPLTPKEKKISGKVRLIYCVKPDGSVGEVKVISGVDPELDAEAVRVVSLMPKWKPGKLAGTPVKVYYPVTVTFTLK